MSDETYCSSGAECPKCGCVIENDAGSLTRWGEQDVEIECPDCETVLLTCPSFSVDFTTRIKEQA